MSVADGWEINPTRPTGLLRAHILAPWVPVVIWLAMAILTGGDENLILSSKTLREQLDIDGMDGLRVRVQDTGPR